MSRLRSLGCVLDGVRYGVRRVTVGEDEQSGRVRRHGEHEQVASKTRRLRGVASVVMVTVASREDLWRKSDSKPSGANTIWPLPRRGRDGPRWCLMPAVAPDDHRAHRRIGRAGPNRGLDSGSDG